MLACVTTANADDYGFLVPRRKSCKYFIRLEEGDGQSRVVITTYISTQAQDDKPLLGFLRLLARKDHDAAPPSTIILHAKEFARRVMQLPGEKQLSLKALPAHTHAPLWPNTTVRICYVLLQTFWLFSMDHGQLLWRLGLPSPLICRHRAGSTDGDRTRPSPWPPSLLPAFHSHHDASC